MESTEKISGHQLCLLVFSFIAPTLILVVPSLMEKISRQDAWMTIFPSYLIGALQVWIMIVLAKRFPGQTIIQYSSQILGKFLGKLLGCYLLYYWINFDFIILNQHIQFINSIFLMRTPSVVVSLTLAILCAIAVYMGIESIARCNEYLSLLIFVLLIPLLLLMLAVSDPQLLRPMLSKGVLPVLQASIFPIAYLGQFMILGWFFPFLSQPKKAAKASFISLSIISGLFCITILPLIMIFGPLTRKLAFPVLSVIQYIGIKGSFERLEAVAVAIWVMGCFVKVSLTFFIICLTIAHLFELKSYRTFIVPVMLLSVIGSVFVFENYSTDLNSYLRNTYPSFAFSTHLLIPLALLLIDTIKRHWKKSVP
ncbi:GerAB/ArcD/ProY family transporter [Paenibacillus qinlingensis]|uniref:GerAB/ArcD/ProY family transporter n=1 Tax=Paenibacillus qinlingensis TaxID=1837343 RepID=UPI001563E3D4|nr:endospore germination permease [Paenibacillus qinlingensis]NQX58285.1 endospore germination permease [Paenibacillus qinlingensis]